MTDRYQNSVDTNCTVEDVAEFAWVIADAMLRAREEEE